jgi:hypothetical protein
LQMYIINGGTKMVVVSMKVMNLVFQVIDMSVSLLI